MRAVILRGRCTFDEDYFTGEVWYLIDAPDSSPDWHSEGRIDLGQIMRRPCGGGEDETRGQEREKEIRKRKLFSREEHRETLSWSGEADPESVEAIFGGSWKNFDYVNFVLFVQPTVDRCIFLEVDKLNCVPLLVPLIYPQQIH
jgi:hypothetical protein